MEPDLRDQEEQSWNYTGRLQMVMSWFKTNSVFYKAAQIHKYMVVIV